MKEPLIPEKRYFKIGEVSKIVGVKPYVLRYWETEFKEIGPIKSRSNQRLYRRKDVETLIAIKQLLYQDGFTISGARKKVRSILRSNGKPKKTIEKTKKPDVELRAEQMGLAFDSDQGKKLLRKLKKELDELRAIIQFKAQSKI